MSFEEKLSAGLSKVFNERTSRAALAVFEVCAAGIALTAAVSTAGTALPLLYLAATGLETFWAIDDADAAINWKKKNASLPGPL